MSATTAVAVSISAARSGSRWWERAACRGLDTELFFPDRGESPAEAKAVCATCPVTEDCLWFALGKADDELRPQRSGIWGGETEFARTKMRRADREAVTQ